MKIAFLSTFYPFRGGIAQFNALLYRELEKDHEVKSYTFTRQYPNFLFPGKTQLVTADDNADEIPSLRILDTINPFSYIRTARAIKNRKPDLVITKYWMTFFAPSLGFVLSRQSRYTKRIAILDNVIPHERRFFDHAFNRYFLNRNDGFIAMTEKVKNDLLKYIPDAKCIVIPHPIYNQFGAKWVQSEALEKLELSKLKDKKLLLFFGIIRDYKGLDMLLEVMALLDDSYHLLIAGEAYGDFNKYTTQMDELNISSRCHVFERYISDQEVPLFFSAADVVMLTYKTATQSGIAGIAQHFELPIIATNVGGLAESIDHDTTGYVCDSLDPSTIKNWVMKYFDEGKKIPMSQALAAQNAHHTWEQFCQKLLHFVSEL